MPFGYYDSRVLIDPHSYDRRVTIYFQKKEVEVEVEATVEKDFEEGSIVGEKGTDFCKSSKTRAGSSE